MLMPALLTLASQTVSAAPAASSNGTPPPQAFSLFGSFFPIVILLILWLFLTGGSKRKQEKERRALLDNLKRGDRVKLFGGEYGSVVDVKETKVLLKVDEGSNTKIWYARDAVAGVEKEETPAASK